MCNTQQSAVARKLCLSMLAFMAALCCTPTWAESSTPLPEQWAAIASDAAVVGKPSEERASVEDREPRRSYAIPAAEIFGFDFLLNQYDRHELGSDYNSNLSSIRRNLHSGWVVDHDPFRINQLGHPYQGSMYHTFARSAGLSYWESFAYTFAGSALWEIAGETTPPSRNDQINTGIGGTFLGEALFRMANLLLEQDDVPPFWRELGAAVISPATGFNRLAFGNRFSRVFASGNPAHYSRLWLGFSGTAQDNGGTATTKLKRNEALVEYSLEYGLPGKPGYTYKRPFDYFAFQATASSANGFENVLVRGLLLGRDYGLGDRYRGVWGLYGGYDYISPQTFRVGSTAFSLGTTAEWVLSDSLVLQGTGLVGAGYAAVSSSRSSISGNYHYGVAPQSLLALRLIYRDRASLDVTGREYFVSRVAAAERAGHDNITRLDAALTFRVAGRHGIALRYLGNRRDASFPDLGDVKETRSTVGIFYTLLGHERFSAVQTR
ncbi:MAG: DUF3943 domain-containing protein [Pseudomonadota bacterium]|nr:DUF3943 domain-containing protein [Pseudomonadota bacterium]